MESARPESFRHDAKVIGVIGFGHLMSHFFQLVLPPLFPLLREEFGTSYAVLGSLVAVYYAASGITQFASGFLVDRLGARPVLLSGLALAASGTLLASLATGIGWLFPIAVVMGVGNGVFHPADFAILNANVAPRRLGYAYSAHGIGGNLGFVVAPVVSFTLGAAFGWRFALAAAGVLGLVALGMLCWQRALLASYPAPDAHLQTLRGSAALFMQAPIMLCFVYFVLITAGGMGLQTFIPTVLGSALDTSLALATSALTAYFIGGTAGILAGGVLAARTARHDRVAGGGMVLGAAALSVVAAGGVPPALLLPAFALIGCALGATGPSRDLIVRAATPRGAAGRVYGFVYSGFDLGGIIGPVACGLLLDLGYAREVFFFVAACYLLGIGAVIRVRRATGEPLALARPAA